MVRHWLLSKSTLNSNALKTEHIVPYIPGPERRGFTARLISNLEMILLPSQYCGVIQQCKLISEVFRCNRKSATFLEQRKKLLLDD